MKQRSSTLRSCSRANTIPCQRTTSPKTRSPWSASRTCTSARPPATRIAIRPASSSTRLQYSNTGASRATGVRISDTVPANTRFLAAQSTPGWSCPDRSAGGTVCVFTIGTVLPGGSGQVNFALLVESPVPPGLANVVNTAIIADDGLSGPDPTPGNNVSSATTPIGAQPDLRISKSDGGVTATPGGIIVYTLTYRNQGDQDATGVVIREVVPANTRFNASISTSGWSCANGSPAGTACTYSVGSLPVGPNRTVVFAVTVDSPLPPGTVQIANTATINDDGSNGADPTPANNTSTVVTPVIRTGPDLRIGKTDGNATATPGGVVVYTLSYTNAGNSLATGVVITETVPPNARFNAASSTAGWSCADASPTGVVCTLNVGSLVVGRGWHGAVRGHGAESAAEWRDPNREYGSDRRRRQPRAGPQPERQRVHRDDSDRRRARSAHHQARRWSQTGAGRRDYLHVGVHQRGQSRRDWGGD